MEGGLQHGLGGLPGRLFSHPVQHLEILFMFAEEVTGMVSLSERRIQRCKQQATFHLGVVAYHPSQNLRQCNDFVHRPGVIHGALDLIEDTPQHLVVADQ